MRKCLTRDELRALMETPGRLRDRLIIRVLYETGLRVGELCALKVSDLDFENEEISIQRAKKHPEGRVVPLVNGTTKILLEEYLDGRTEGAVFLSNKGGGLTRRGVEHLVTNLGIRVGLDRSKRHPHMLRHTHAVDALNNGIDLRTLRDNLGHSDIAITSIYLASSTELRERKEKYRKHFEDQSRMDRLERPIPSESPGYVDMSWSIDGSNQ